LLPVGLWMELVNSEQHEEGHQVCSDTGWLNVWRRDRSFRVSSFLPCPPWDRMGWDDAVAGMGWSVIGNERRHIPFVVRGQ
jgi:hypothetical protein